MTLSKDKESEKTPRKLFNRSENFISHKVIVFR